MIFARTISINGIERVVTVLPLSKVPKWDPNNPLPGTYLVDSEVQRGWIRDGAGFVPPPPPTLGEIQKQYTDAVQKWMDDFARTRGYDDMKSAADYRDSGIPKFKAEGQYCYDMRDAVWVQCYSVMDEVLSGQRPLPTISELFGLLPTLEWPE